MIHDDKRPDCAICEDQGHYKIQLECSVCGRAICPACSYDWSGDLMCVRCDPVELDYRRFVRDCALEAR